MSRNSLRHLSLCLAATSFLTLAGCNTETPPTLSTTGTSKVLLTDAPPFPYSKIARADIYIVNVSVSLSADTSAAAGSGSFVTVASPNRKVNVLALQNGLTEQLGTFDFPKGAVTAVRMTINTDSSSITLKDGRVITGRSTPAIQWQSSAGQPTLNALIHEQILVPDSGAVVVIDFDLGKSFILPQEVNPSSSDSGFIFSPVLHAADAARTGTITGTVRANSTSGSPVADASLRLYLGTPGTAENTWSMLATAKSDANGAFRFSYVTRSSYWASLPAQAGKTYIVTADPPAGSSSGSHATVPNLSVSAKTETSAGTLVLLPL